METDARLQLLRQLRDTPLKPCALISDKFIPIPPHKVGIAHLILKPRFLLADPTGCGKTPQSLGAFAFLKVRDPQLRLLVMAERSAIFQWKTSISTFLTDVKPKIVGYDLDSGSAVSRFTRYDTYENSNADVFLLSYHQMARDIDSILRYIGNYVIIFDEVQTLKGSNGKSMYPAAQKLSIKGRYVWGLTATPIMNRLDELHAIMEIIRPGTFGSYDSFSTRYLKKVLYDPSSKREYELDDPHRPRTRAYLKTKGVKNLPELMKIIRPFFLRRKAEEIDKHLPKMVVSPKMLEMEPTQAAHYEMIRHNKFPDTLEKKGRKLSKFAALCYAQLVSDAPSLVGLSGTSSKITELKHILREEINGEKVIIYSRFRRGVDLLCDTLTEEGYKHVRITGKEGTKEREDAKLVFNHSKDVNFICINRAGGTSLDLPQAKIMIFFDLPWSWGEWQQVLGRSRRIGSPHEKVLAIPLLNRNTIDTHVYSVLEDKESLVERTFGTEATLAIDTDDLFDKVIDRVA